MNKATIEQIIQKLDNEYREYFDEFMLFANNSRYRDDLIKAYYQKVDALLPKPNDKNCPEFVRDYLNHRHVFERDLETFVSNKKIEIIKDRLKKIHLEANKTILEYLNNI